MKAYTVEQIDNNRAGRITARHVEADGYTWSQGGVVSFARFTHPNQPTDPDTPQQMETFATLFNIVSVYEQNTLT